MNLTQKLKRRIVAEFKRGREMAENDRLFMLRPGTTERLVREALKAQDETVEGTAASDGNQPPLL